MFNILGVNVFGLWKHNLLKFGNCFHLYHVYVDSVYRMSHQKCLTLLKADVCACEFHLSSVLDIPRYCIKIARNESITPIFFVVTE